MQLKKLLFIKLLITLSIAPRFAGAQYSFQWVLRTVGEDGADKMIETSDGKFIVLGGSSGTDSLPGGNYIARFNQNGTMVWQKYGIENHYGTQNGLADILEKNNNTFYIGGGSAVWQYSGNAAYLKMDSSGHVLWDSAYRVNDGGGGGIMKVIDDPENQVLVSIGPGATDDNHTYWMFQKTSYMGQRIMYKYIMETLNIRLRDFFRNSDQSGYTVFTDTTPYFNTNKYIIGLDTNGNTIFKKHIGIDEIFSIVQNADNTYTLLRGLSGQYYLEKYSAQGDSQYLKPLSSETGLILKWKDDGYIVFTVPIQYLDSNMNLVSTQQGWTGPDSAYSLSMVAQASDGGFYGCGQYRSNHPDILNRYDFYIFKTAPDGTLTSTINYMDIPVTGTEEIHGLLDQIRIYPNPATDKITIEGVSSHATVTVNNVLGERIYSGSNTGNIDVSILSRGIYFISVIDDEGSRTTKKVVIQ